MAIEQLSLLIPEDLPIQHELGEISKKKLSSSLNLVLRSLEVQSMEQAHAQVERALSILDTANILAFNTIQGAKKQQEAQEYDNYFNVSHIKSDRPEISLVRSILVAYQRFLLLSDRSNQSDAKNIERQRQGFATYIQLVSRVFNLSLNQNYAED